MNIKSFILCLGLAAGAASMMSSCSDPKGENRMNSVNIPSFAVITNLEDGTQTIDNDMHCSLSFETYNGTLGLDVTGVDVPGKGKMSFSTGDLKYTIGTDGGMSFKEVDKNVGIGILNELKCTAYPIASSFTGTLESYMNISMTLDNEYAIRIVDNGCLWYGKTQVITMRDQSVYETYEPIYAVSFDPTKGKATLYLYRARFSDRMPQAFDMIFGDIAFNIGQNSYSLGSEALIPKIGDKPYEMYEITDLTITGSFTDNTLKVSFVCAGMYQVHANLAPVFKTDK